MDLLDDYKPAGDLLKIYTYPSTILKKVAAPVTDFDEELQTLCKNMLYTMYKAPGIGLAAPQIGKSIRLFVMDIDFERNEITRADGSTDYELTNLNPRVIINPKFKNKSGEILYEEGCLSVPGIYESVKRFDSIQLDYFDLGGQKQTIGTDGMLSE